MQITFITGVQLSLVLKENTHCRRNGARNPTGSTPNNGRCSSSVLGLQDECGTGEGESFIDYAQEVTFTSYCY